MIPVLFPDFPSLLPISVSQHENQPLLLPRLQDEILLQAAAVIAALFKRASAFSPLHRLRVGLAAISSEKSIPEAVESVRFKIGCKKLITKFLIEQIMFYDPILAGGSGAVEAHLEILIIDHDMVPGKFQVGKKAQAARTVTVIPDGHVPEKSVVIQRDKHPLGSLNSPVSALIDRVGQSVAAAVYRLIQAFSDRLPGDAEIIPVLVITQIQIVPRPVHGDSISPETGHPVILRRAAEQISARRMIEHRAHVLHAQIIGP